MSEQDVDLAAEALDGLLAAVQSGRLDARSPAATALRRRLEGAALALRMQAHASHGGPRS